MKPKLIFSAKKLIEEINMANRDIFDKLKRIFLLWDQCNIKNVFKGTKKLLSQIYLYY
jgi:hypothetical protein